MTVSQGQAPSRKIGLREFLRGGYHDIKQPVLVMNRKKPVAMWVPYTDEPISPERKHK